MNIKNSLTGFVFALFAVTAAVPSVFAQSFPSKPVRILVGFGAGGSTDIVARVLAQNLNAGWKRTCWSRIVPVPAA